MLLINLTKIIMVVDYLKIKYLELNFMDDFIQIYDKKVVFIISIVVQEDLIHYYTSRIDIKNYGNQNNHIEFLYVSDDKSKLELPDWFKDKNGVGAVVESFESNLDLKIKCINDGKLILKLKGIDAKWKGVRIPIFINFKSVIINGVQQINEYKLVSHDDNYECSVNVCDGDIVFIHIESSPFKI